VNLNCGLDGLAIMPTRDGRWRTWVFLLICSGKRGALCRVPALIPYVAGRKGELINFPLWRAGWCRPWSFSGSHLSPAQVFYWATWRSGGWVCTGRYRGDRFAQEIVLVYHGRHLCWRNPSVIVQVASFKLTRAPGCFRMAPIHHYLSLTQGWPEPRVIVPPGGASGLLTVILVLIGLAP